MYDDDEKNGTKVNPLL
jgi:hypothetical protein